MLVTCSLRLAVSGDALQLMAELLKIFVVGEQRDPIVSSGSHPGLSGPLVIHLHFSVRLSRHLFPIFPQAPCP